MLRTGDIYEKQKAYFSFESDSEEEEEEEEDTSEMSEDSIPRIKNIKINKHKKNYKNSLEKYNNYYKASTNNLILNKKKMNESANKRSSFFQK